MCLICGACLAGAGTDGAGRSPVGPRRDRPAVDARPAGPRGRPAGPKLWARAQVERIGAELATQQEMLFAQAKVARSPARRVLLVLQAMDCGGKDGTVKRRGRRDEPARACTSWSFGPPTRAGARARLPVADPQALPPAGTSACSTGRTTRTCWSPGSTVLAPERSGGRATTKINAFERELVDGGLTPGQGDAAHLPRGAARAAAGAARRPGEALEVQPRRPRRAGRLGRVPGRVRRGRCARVRPDAAPWYVVPADRKWYRELGGGQPAARDVRRPRRCTTPSRTSTWPSAAPSAGRGRSESARTTGERAGERSVNMSELATRTRAERSSIRVYLAFPGGRVRPPPIDATRSVP